MIKTQSHTFNSIKEKREYDAKAIKWVEAVGLGETKTFEEYYGGTQADLKPKKVEVEGLVPDIKKLRADYKMKFNKGVSPRFINDVEWITNKLNA